MKGDFCEYSHAYAKGGIKKEYIERHFLQSWRRECEHTMNKSKKFNQLRNPKGACCVKIIERSGFHEG